MGRPAVERMSAAAKWPPRRRGEWKIRVGSLNTSIDERMLVLACVLEVASDMTFNHIGRDPMVVPNELIREPGAGKTGFRLRNDRLLRPSVQGDEQCTTRESDLDRAGASQIRPLVGADIFRQDFGSDLHRRFLSIRR